MLVVSTRETRMKMVAFGVMCSGEKQGNGIEESSSCGER